MYSVSKCQYKKYTEFYIGYLWFGVTFIGNAAVVPPVVNILPHAT
jgi:hypothetical protein